MWNRFSLSQTGSRVALLIGQLAVLFLCIGYLEYIYISNILPDKNAKQTFKSINCFIISKKLSSKGHLMHGYRADFYISYTVKNELYRRWVSGNGLDQDINQNESDQEDILAQYDVGARYTCYYDPSNPKASVLLMRHDWLSIYPLFVPCVLIVLVFYFLIRNSFKLLNTTLINVPELHEKQTKNNKRQPKIKKK